MIGPLIAAVDVNGNVRAAAFIYNPPRNGVLSIPAPSWQPFEPNMSYALSGGQYFMSDASNIYSASLEVRAGMTLTMLECEIADRSPTQNITYTFDLRKRDRLSSSTGTFLTMSGTTSGSIVSGTTAVSLGFSHAVTDATAMYTIFANMQVSPASVNEFGFFGCRVFYTTTTPMN